MQITRAAAPPIHMYIISLCKSIAASFSDNLRLATSPEERHAVATEALKQCDKVLWTLYRLQEGVGEASEEYQRARDAVLDLLTTVGIPFVRGCTMYASGVAFLEELAGCSNDPLVCKKLFTYGSQLKKRWREVEQGGGAHRPRAGGLAQLVQGRGLYLGGAALLLLGLLALRVDFGSLLGASETQVAQKPAPTASQSAQNPAAPASGSENGAPPAPKKGESVRYTDENGVEHVVSNPAMVPPQYRTSMQPVAPGEVPRGVVSKVVCEGNRVLVPVRLRFRDLEVSTVLLLDTGASVTAINEDVASRLGIERTDVREGASMVADGRSVTAYLFSADLITVGPRRLPFAKVVILPGTGGDGTEGLLGMNFLKEFRYHIDFKRSVIEWGE